MYAAVIDILKVLEFASYDRKYTGIAKYPAVTRDISMVLPKEVLVGQIEAIIEQRGGNILKAISCLMYMREARLKKALNQLRIRLHSVQLTEPLKRQISLP